MIAPATPEREGERDGPCGEARAPEPPPPVRADDLLAWYDRHRRAMPWRALPGETADPYRVWLSEVMLQQTTVAAVKPYFERFLQLFPTVAALAAAPSEAVMAAWAGLGYYSRARNLHKGAQAVVARHGGVFPGSEAELLALPGIGPYTAAAVAAIAFNRVAAAVDGNVERVLTRLYGVEQALPAAKGVVRSLTLALVPPERPGDFAQALMDLGATLCTPRRPACAICPWRDPCVARREGRQGDFPVKTRKIGGVLRRGAAFVVRRADGALMLRTRPPSGLLGGMAEVPGSEWSAGYDPAKAMLDAPLDARWRRLEAPVRHVFTHFPLELTVFVGKATAAADLPEGCRWTPRARLGEEPLSSLMKKVLAAAGG